MGIETPRAVLVVDDDAAVRRMIAKLLSDAGYITSEASDGEEAFEAILREQHSLIVSDWAMPRMDGIELIRNLRSASLSWYPYVLLLTAIDDRTTGMKSGADDFLNKPIDRELLLQRVCVGHRIIRLHETLCEKNVRLNEANGRLTELAIKDALSGLLNRRAFFEIAQKEWSRSIRYDLSISCLLIDIDHFKCINDTYGHPAGDSVIREVGEVVRQIFRDSDVTGRYGGEEFSVVLYDCDIDAAAAVAERFRQSIESLRMPEIAKGFNFTISCGVANRTLDMLGVESLIENADQALLAAKRLGRNQVVRFDELESGSKKLESISNEVDRDDRLSESDNHQVVNTLLTALKYRDFPTVDHSRRVAELCREFARHLGFAPSRRATLEVAALLHDVGRIAIPDNLLKKTGELTEAEFIFARQHHQVTVDILKRCFKNRAMISAVQYAGMWFDGSQGDPAGETIPEDARILAICSFYDDLHYGRGWWNPHSPADAIDVLQQAAGTRFDPRLVNELSSLVLAKEKEKNEPVRIG